MIKGDIENDLAEFCNQDEQTMVLHILSADCLDIWIAAGERGDKEARASVISIHDWMRQADKALDEGHFPACGYCEQELEKGWVGGWAILLPIDEGVGLVFAYCADCIKTHNREELTNHFVQRAQAKFGIRLMTAQ
jgi:hypothetical protein